MGMTIQEAINRINKHMSIHHIGQYPHIHLAEAMQMALDALREKAEREEPKPLTLEELRQMDGEPVYIERIGWRIHHGMQLFIGEYHLYTGVSRSINISKDRVNIYRHKPKEG